jgi:hypothetical protein
MPNEQSKIANILLNTGITRNTPYGGMEDVVNACYTDGALRPVQKGRRLGAAPSYDAFIIHPVSDINHWIGYNKTLRTIDEFRQTGTEYDPPLSVTITNIITLAAGETLIDFKTLKKYLIITTSAEMYKYLFIDGVYTLLNINNPIQLTLEAYDDLRVSCDGNDHNGSAHDEQYTDNGYSLSEELKGWVYEQLADQSNTYSRLSGAVSFIAVYKLFDGSYVMQTTPIIQQSTYETPTFGTLEVPLIGVESWNIWDFTDDRGGKTVRFNANQWKVKIYPSYYANMIDESNIIESICVFFSKPILKYDIEKTLVDEPDGNWNPLYHEQNKVMQFYLVNKISDDWENLASPEAGWFLVAEIPFRDILDCEDEIMDTESYMDLKGFYSNYATREALPVDQYTHHRLTAEKMFIYNSRLWLTGVTKYLGTPDPFITMMTESTVTLTVLPAKILYRLKVDNIIKTVISDEFSLNSIVDGTSRAFVRLPIISYYDDRAYEFSLYVFHDGVWKEFMTHSMTKSTTHNFSYYFLVGDDPESLQTAGYIFWYKVRILDNLTIVDDPSLQLNNIDDSLSSQIQLSSLSNPFVYPSSLNYPVGNGSVNWFAVTQDALSEGQFGQFPVIAFTSEGLYALTIGTGEVVVSSVTPVSPDIAVGVPVGTSQGIFFPSKEGIMILQGRKVTDISISLRGKIGVIASGDDKYFALYSNHNQVCNLDTVITTLNEFRIDLPEMILGYDHDWKRIFATKPGLGYSYVFDILTNKWYRVSEDSDYFVHTSSKTYMVNNRGLIDLSDLTDNDTNTTIEVHWHTKPMTFNTNHRKKLEETLLKCQVQTSQSNYASFAMFASNDGEKWYMITANDRKTREINDIQLTFAFASYKYFVFSFWGRLQSEYDNFFDSIDVEVKERYSHRLRSY